MKRRTNTSCGVYQYLEFTGVLDTGDSGAIAEARKTYWREQKRIWKQVKRKNETEFKIYLTDIELQIIGKAAKAHSRSRTRYIKDAAFAYTDKRFLIVDQAAVNHIMQLLSLNYSVLQELADNLSLNHADALLRQMEDLERRVLAALCSPETNTSMPQEP